MKLSKPSYTTGMLRQCFYLVGLCLLLSIAGFLFGQVESAAVIRYSFEEVPITFTPAAMNNRGWIVGGINYPMRYRPGVGQEQLSESRGQLYDINDAGTAVGILAFADPGPGHKWEAIVRPAGAPYKRLGGYQSQAQAINEAGQIVGYFLTPGNDRRPFVYTEATGMRQLFDREGAAYGINEVGQIAGNLRPGHGAFLWDPVLGLIDIEAQVGRRLSAGGGAISDSGIVAGTSTARITFTFSIAEGLRRIGNLSPDYESPFAINDRGWIVGDYRTTFSGTPRTYLYVRGQGMRDLNTLTPGLTQTLIHAVDINDRDEILAVTDSPYRYYLLKRIRD